MNSSQKPKELAMTTRHFRAMKICDILLASKIVGVCHSVRVRSNAFPTKACV